MKRAIFRIIDANFNRSREGLRVCEDVARFILNSPKLTKELKAIRHALSAIMREPPIDSRILYESRDVETDVGRRSRFKSEMKRLDSIDIFYANIERVKESIRVLEEFTKLAGAKAPAKFAALRYRVYDVEKRFNKKVSSLRDRRP
ncbi:MAG: thiamine-phosphate pyrophosphorylase [Candidatus Omnitrophica bacterium]|nr:thiamine-phosphate pyrophosphorylase [Candidatus Omnitrophota bacterium]